MSSMKPTKMKVGKVSRFRCAGHHSSLATWEEEVSVTTDVAVSSSKCSNITQRTFNKENPVVENIAICCWPAQRAKDATAPKWTTSTFTQSKEWVMAVHLLPCSLSLSLLSPLIPPAAQMSDHRGWTTSPPPANPSSVPPARVWWPPVFQIERRPAAWWVQR